MYRYCIVQVVYRDCIVQVFCPVTNYSAGTLYVLYRYYFLQYLEVAARREVRELPREDWPETPMVARLTTFTGDQV